MEEQPPERQDEDDSEEIPPKDWKELINVNDNETLKNVDTETFQKQFMEHPNKEQFIDWQSDDIEDGNTMLISAIAEKRFDIVKILLDHGADVNIAEKDGWTALMWASHEGHNETAKLLLEKGADIAAVDNKGTTALMYASKNGHNEIVKLLIEKGVDITAVNEDGSTAFNFAYRNGHNEIVKFLLQQPQQQQQRQDEEIPPKDWKWLIENSNTKMKNVDIETFKKQFMEHPNKERFINWKNVNVEYGKTMLCCAILYKRYDIAQVLLDHGADITITSKTGMPALMYASQNGHNETVKLLVKMGADVTAVDKDGWTALAIASDKGHNDTVKLLLEKGADVAAVNVDGWTALMVASQNGHNETVKLLIEKGADVTAATKKGTTALMKAAENGHHETVKILLEMGADVTAATKDGKIALSWAFRNGHNQIVKFLLQQPQQQQQRQDEEIPPEDWKWLIENCRRQMGKVDNLDIETFKKLFMEHPNKERFVNWKSDDSGMGNDNTMLGLAIMYKRYDIAKLLIDHGADVNNIDNDGDTALMYASQNGHNETVNLLVENGADISSVNKNGWTALMYASDNGDNETVKLLLEKGADVTAVNKDGNTVLGWAVEQGHTNTVELLLAKGADCKTTNKSGRTVFSIAYYAHRTDMVNLFLEKAPLKDIIHEVVNYADFAGKFFELYQDNREIVNWLDQDGRTVRSMACKECREVILFMGQYDMDDQPMYESPTCQIYNGRDFGGSDEQLQQPRPVAMKMMENEEHYLNELRARRKHDGSPRFSSEFVTPNLAAYRADEDPEFAKARETWNNNNGSKEKKIPDFFIPMEKGGRNLMESMNAENLSAEHKNLQRREILLNLVIIFVYIHEVGYIHGDIKPHNVVRHVGDRGTSWKAIDFDACTKIGDIVGLKLTTGSAPPEMMKIVNGGDAASDTASRGKSKVVLRQPGGDLDEDDLVKADPSFDVWSFGILMYQLVTGRSFFHSDLQGNVNEEGLQELANLTQDRIHKKLESVADANAQVVLKDILRLDPKDRPTMSEIEEYPYFHPSKESDPQGPSTLEYTSAGQVVPKSVSKLTIGKDLEQIAKGVCSGNGQLEEVDTSKAHSLEVVGEKAFSSCRALEEFQCPSSVKAIGLEAFHECVKLQDFMFSKAQALESIGDRAFYDCRALTMFKCPSNVKVIGKHAFHGCESLQDVDLSEAHALETIEGRAFSFCSAVQKVAIPENVTVVGEGFLDECGALESLVIAGENPILHINVLLRLPEPKRELVAMDSIVEMYSNNPVKTSELSGESSKVASLLQEVKEGFAKSIKTSDDPIRKISKRDGWVEFLSAHANDSKEDCIQMLITFLESGATISVVRILADATDRLGRIAKMIAPEHIRKVFEKRLFFLGRYDIAKGPPIHKSATCIVMKAMDAQMSDYYKKMFEELVNETNTVDKEKFTEILQKMKLISYDERNIKELFDKVDVDKNGTVSKAEFVDFCMAELGHDVVLKFMRNKDQYRRELNGRDGLDPRFVVGCIRNHDTTTNPDLLKSLQDTMQSQEEEDSGEILEKTDDASMSEYCYVIVMPFGDRNLATISQSERPGSLAVRKMMQEVGEALCHLHEKNIVHGDLKMLNVVRSNGRLSLIDLDASGRIDKDFMGSKFSSGVVPPEMLYELKGVKELNVYTDYVAKGGSKGEKEKREAVFTKDKVNSQCFVVRSFWEKEVIEERKAKWTGETLTTVKSVPILDGLPYFTEVRHHQSFGGSEKDEAANNVLVRAAPSFDVWSFGVLLYRLLKRDPLFHVNDEDDIKNGDALKHLYQWSDSELVTTIESDVADPYAKRLLQKILRSDPTDRWTMAQVLNDEYFKVDLVKDMSDVHEEVLDNRHFMTREFARVHSSLQQIQRFQAVANTLLQEVIKGPGVPRYFLILPQLDSIDTPNKMTVGQFFSKVKDAMNPDSYIKQRARLCFICPLSLRPVVNASGEAIGFDIEVPKDWVRKYGPAILIGMKVAEVAMSVGRCFGLPLPSLSGVEDALAERSEVFSKLQELIVSVGKEGDDEEGGTIVDALASGLTDKLEGSLSNDIKTSDKIRNRLQNSYDGIEDLIPAGKHISDCGLIKAQHEGKSPEEWVSEYVHPKWKDVFVKLGTKSLEMTIEELEIEKAKLDSLSTIVSSSTEGESRRETTDIPSLGMATPNRGSRSPVYADELVEEVSMTDSNIPELPNRPASDRLYGKLDNMERNLDNKMDDMEHKIDKLLQNQHGANPTSSTTVENKVVIFHGWLSKQSREHSLLWQDRYFEIYNDGDVAYYPKGVRRGDLGYGVKLFKSVKWSKIDSAEHKLELKSQDMFVLGRVKQSSMNTDSTINEWMEKGNSWRIIESPPSSGIDGKDTKSTSSKPRPRVAQTAADGSIIRR